MPAAPGGIGIFETCLLIRIGSSVAEAPLLASLLCYRLVASLADLMAASLVGLKKISCFR